MGKVEATVRSLTGEPMARFGIKIKALTPTELQDVAYSTNASGVIHLSLSPGKYIISAHGRDGAAHELQGVSAELLVEAGCTVTVDIVVERIS